MSARFLWLSGWIYLRYVHIALSGHIVSVLLGHHGVLSWSGRWVVFIDLMLQFQVFSKPGDLLLVPTRITKLEINPEFQNKFQDENIGKSG